MKKVIIVSLLIGIVVLLIATPFIIFGDVIDTLELACNEYAMNYEYREGANCLDSGNRLRPISYECGTFKWDGCEIRFIKD